MHVSIDDENMNELEIFQWQNKSNTQSLILTELEGWKRLFKIRSRRCRP